MPKTPRLRNLPLHGFAQNQLLCELAACTPVFFVAASTLTKQQPKVHRPQPRPLTQGDTSRIRNAVTACRSGRRATRGVVPLAGLLGSFGSWGRPCR